MLERVLGGARGKRRLGSLERAKGDGGRRSEDQVDTALSTNNQVRKNAKGHIKRRPHLKAGILRVAGVGHVFCAKVLAD